MQRTFNPTYHRYYGNGTGRDHQIIEYDGGLTSNQKGGLGNTGVHLQRYNTSVTRRRISPSPNKDPSTHYYQSDGSGRDSYVLMDNGGLRPEYEKYNKTSEKIFFGSLRTGVKSPLRYFKDQYRDKADITTYMNWGSAQSNRINAKHAKIQRDLVKRLTGSRSPSDRSRGSVSPVEQRVISTEPSQPKLRTLS